MASTPSLWPFCSENTDDYSKGPCNFLYGKDSGTSVHSDPRSHYMTNRQIKAMLTQAALGCHHIQSSYGELLYPTRGTWEEEAGRTEQCQEDRYSDR